jgi:tetratricopeptide (TPR) repeat protein
MRTLIVRPKLFVSLASIAACALAAVTFDPAPAQAQRAGAQNEEQRPETRRVPTMSTPVHNLFSEAQECAENEDFQCAERLLGRIRNMRDLSSFELANMWSFYGFIYYSQDNYAEAIRSYENVLAQEDLPLGIETNTTQTLAGLYFQEEQYEKALEMLEHWLSLQENPQPDPYIMKAQIHYQLRQYREGIQPVQQALDIARERGLRPQENWYQLLNIFHYELEEYDRSIEVLHILVENWPKKEYVVTLGALYGQRGDENRQLALFESAYEAGWLDRGTELVNLASMLMQANIPYKAARIMEAGLNNETIESTEANWRLLSQALQLAQEHEKALPALTRAAGMANDGNLHLQLATSYQSLARWDECVTAAREALRVGGLRRDDTAQLVLGGCLSELKRYDEALQAFQVAARDERSRQSAQQFINYVRSEQERERQLEQALAARR